jgi:hypothetical protein
MKPNEHQVRLADGREVSNYSEEYRHECECRWLLEAKPTRREKHLHLYGVPDRDMLFEYSPKTGRPELAEDHAKRWQIKFPLMKVRGIDAADRILADARKIHELSQPARESA